MSHGTTLVEHVAALVILATLLGLAAPPISGLRSRILVDRAVADLRGALLETRSRSVGRGAALVLHRTPPSASVVVGGRVERTVGLAGVGGVVTIDFGGGESRVIRFDALGIGRFASASVRFASGGVERRVVVSSWGRARVE